jgi:hypothetical protein
MGNANKIMVGTRDHSENFGVVKRIMDLREMG